MQVQFVAIVRLPSESTFQIVHVNNFLSICRISFILIVILRMFPWKIWLKLDGILARLLRIAAPTCLCVCFNL